MGEKYPVGWPVAKGFMQATFSVLGGIEERGRDNVPRSGGVLLCPNHVCDADPAAVAVTCPRFSYFMAKAGLFDIPVLGLLMRYFGCFPVKRNSADRAALRHAETLLKNGEVVVVFPEGGGNHENTLQPLYPGPLLLALRTRVPVVPVAIENTHFMWPYSDKLPRRSGKKVIVTYGEPLDLTGLYGKKGATDEATHRLTLRLATMLKQPVPQGKPHHKDE